MRHCLDGEQDEYDLKWPSFFFSLPEIVRKTPAAKSKAKTKAIANGDSKKAR